MGKTYGNPLQRCLVHPSQVTLETPQEICALFIVSIAPALEELLKKIDYVIDMTSGNKYLNMLKEGKFNNQIGICLSLLNLCWRANTAGGLRKLSVMNMHVPRAYRLLLKLCHVLLFTGPTNYFILPRIISPILRKGMHLHRQSKDESVLEENIQRMTFPLNNPDHVVIAGSAESLLYSILETQTLKGHSPVILVPGILFYPHSSLIPFLHARGIEVSAYDVDLPTYAADVASIEAILLSEAGKVMKNYFLILPTILGRSVSNLQEVLRVLRTHQVFSVELCVPTVGWSSLTPSTTYSHDRGESADVVIISLKTVCAMDGAVGCFRDISAARLSCKKAASYGESRLSWILLIQKVFHFFLSNRLGFGLAVSAVKLLSSISFPSPHRKNDALKSKSSEEDFISIPYRKVREAGDHCAASLNTMRAGSTKIANMLIFFSKHYSRAVLEEQCEVLWGTLALLPPYITVISVGTPSKPLDSTQVAGSSIIICVQNADGVSKALRSIGFDAINLETYSADERVVVNTCSLKHKVVYFSKTKIGSSTIGKFVMVPLSSSVPSSQRKQLVNKLLSLPKEYFFSVNAEPYASEEVVTLLDQIKTNKMTAHCLSKL